ncbi:MAG TPA: phage tail assembly protein [Chromatiaceae bacterium]|jgi:hypothetical protein|nr:MAG: phage tail assembly protein [Thiohalocapsa sp. PB-PSB1]HBG94701.1 phage tail assembly protein [Chromatiaceae bacterium]HCS90221.1 phage tail assembly protein [Chromatiaceae bacterium]
MEKTTIKLRYPLRVNGQEVTEIQLRRPKVRDRLAVEKMSASQAEKEVRFIANLCEMAPDEIEELDMADYTKIQETVTGFLS